MMTVGNAFTIVELAIIIGIIGIIGVFAVTQMMELPEDATEATLDNYYRQLRNGYVQYTVIMGKRPKRFEDFVAPDRSLLDPENGIVVSSITDQNGRANCIFNIPGPGRGDNTLACAGGNWLYDRRRHNSAVYSFDANGDLVMEKVDRLYPNA